MKFLKPWKLFESFDDTIINETFYLTNRGDKSSQELSKELEWIEDSTLDLVDSGCTIKVRTYYVEEKSLGLNITIETYRLNQMLPIEVGDNLLTIDSYLRELGFVGYSPYDYDNPYSSSRYQTKVDASLDDVKNNFERELSQFVQMLSRFTVKAPFDTVRVSYFRPEVIETDN
jgi:hypothetical protein